MDKASRNPSPNRRDFISMVMASGMMIAGSSSAQNIQQGSNTASWPDHVKDFPILTVDGDDVIWMAAIERPNRERRIVLSTIDGNTVLECHSLLVDRATGIGPPAIAPLIHGCIVAFPVEQFDRWRIAYTFVNRNSATPLRFVACDGSVNDTPALAVTRDGAWLLWASNAGKDRGIYATAIDKTGNGQVLRVSGAGGNSYNPAVIPLSNGNLFAAWDSMRDSSIDIYGAWYRDGQWEPERRISTDPRIERHPALTVHNDEVWIAWQAQSYDDIAVNQTREQRIVVAGLRGDRLHAPRNLFSQVSTDQRFLMRPGMTFDSHGLLWLSARQGTDDRRTGWAPVVWCYDGKHWHGPVALTDLLGRWRPVAMTASGNRTVGIAQYDDLPKRQGAWLGKFRDWRSGLRICAIPDLAVRNHEQWDTEPLRMPPTDFSIADKMSRCSAKLLRYTIPHDRSDLTVFWGDLHDHTDISMCNRRDNPPGLDIFANVRDIERLDFCALTDHGYNFDFPQWDYNGEQTRRHHDPGRFVTFLAEEWTSNVGRTGGGYGHRNLIFLNPSHRTFYDSFDGNVTPTVLWDQLENTDFICIPHQIADWKGKGRGNPPTDWNYVHEQLQPVAEIFQTRGSYEYLGSPRQSGEATPFRGHFLQDAWARGIIIGVIASPDHGGGRGKVGVWAEELTRKSIFKAIQARRTFGTSGAKMGLFVRSGDALMGEKTPRADADFRFYIRAWAMRNITELVIFRNNAIVYSATPKRPECEIEWRDQKPLPDPFVWYYVRIQSADQELAWSSPIWFTDA